MWLTIGMILAGALLVASIMEIIKHKVFDDGAEKTKMVLLGLLFSIIITPIIYFGFSMIGKPIAMLFYMLAIYVIQKQMDMKAIRPLIKKKILKKLDEL